MSEVLKHEEPLFRINTETLPEGVITGLAEERNLIIRAWRDGQISAPVAHESILRLYWATQRSANDETKHFLMTAVWQFPVESEMADEQADEIFLRLQAHPEAHPYMRTFTVTEY